MADLDPIDRARAAITDRAELPGMSLMEHLAELRKRLIHATVYLLVGFCVAYAFHERLYGIVQKPLDDLHIALNFTHPTDGLNLYLKTSLLGGAIIASPFILYQLWLFISPGMYANEKRYVFPFMGATIGLFLAGAWFGYHWVLPGAIKVLVLDFGKKFNPILTIEDYTQFFLAVILGLGICFELPILVFFLSLFGIVDAKFLIKHIRYAILVIFLISAIICPLPDPFSMILFATPMLVLYLLGVGVAYFVHPSRRKAREKTSA
ncbi:twin-arginine translocase subunit TatC [Granulicella sp. L60]|jgi:sec-independent protein translocase protein TatC|uniref:twin-arginine translocase subunit TatC n=1 Tax=Granulicella sp. L60 TaxID=1641866 RepID=UPI00131DCC38|nr:twin-arginine translocase subunit TatC [Granulicella sp. L60]